MLESEREGSNIVNVLDGSINYEDYRFIEGNIVHVWVIIALKEVSINSASITEHYQIQVDPKPNYPISKYK